MKHKSLKWPLYLIVGLFLAFLAMTPPVSAAEIKVGATTEDHVAVLVNRPHLAALFVGGSILLVALLSAWLRRWWMTGPMVCLAVGMLIGPLGFQMFVPMRWPHYNHGMELIARATLSVSLMAAALHLPRDWIRESSRQAALFTMLTMGLMWGAATLILKGVLATSWSNALLLGAIMTPTDPVLASTIVTGPLAERNIPARLRNLLHAESAANDGLAFLFVTIALLVDSRAETSLGYAIGWQIVGATIVGAVAGWLVGLLQKSSVQLSLAEYNTLLAVAIALAIAVGGGIRAADGDGVLAVFAAGLAFRLTIPEDALYHAEEQIQDVVQRVFQLPIFVLIGMLLPWSQWIAMGWQAPALIVAILMLRRIPALLLIHRIFPVFHCRTDALFCGWFGPIGIAAVFYAVMVERVDSDQVVWPVVSLMIVASTLIHGLTATPFTNWVNGEGDVA